MPHVAMNRDLVLNAMYSHTAAIEAMAHAKSLAITRAESRSRKNSASQRVIKVAPFARSRVDVM